MRSKKGQSTLEYVIILAAVVGVIIAIATILKGNLRTSYTTLGGKMENKVSSVNF